MKILDVKALDIEAIKVIRFARFCDREEITNAKHITACMNKPSDLFGCGQHKYKFVPLDGSFPKYVVEHQDRYQHLIKDIQ